MSPQIKNFSLGLYRWNKASSRFFINWLKSPVGVLYKLNTVKQNELVSSSTAEISKLFSLQFCEILILLNYRSLRTKIHIPLSVDFDVSKLILIHSLVIWEAACPVPPFDAHWNIVHGE